MGLIIVLCDTRFHTRGLFALAQLNGIVTYEVSNTFAVPPAVCMPNRVRSYFALSDKRKKTHKDSFADITESRDEDAVDVDALGLVP